MTNVNTVKKKNNLDTQPLNYSPSHFSLCASVSPFFPQNKHWEYERISPHEVSTAKSVGLKWRTSSGWLCRPARFLLHRFRSLRGWFYWPADCSTGGVKYLLQLGSVAIAALEPFDACVPISLCACTLGGQAASGDRGQCSSHGCTHAASLQAQSLAAELSVAMGCAGTAAKMYACPE